MMTWFQLWPLVFVPYVLTFAAGLVPFVREGLINHLMLPLVPHDTAVTIVHWYRDATPLQEMGLHFVITLNLGTLVYPVFYVAGALLIKINHAKARAELSSLNQA